MPANVYHLVRRRVVPVIQLFLTWTIQTRAYRFCLNFLHVFCFGVDNPSKDLYFQNVAPHLWNYFAQNQFADLGGKAHPPFAENLHKVEFEWLPYDGLELYFKVLWDFKQVRSTLVLSTKKQFI